MYNDVYNYIGANLTPSKGWGNNLVWEFQSAHTIQVLLYYTYIHNSLLIERITRGFLLTGRLY